MKSRLVKWCEEMTAEITDQELAAGISNGDVNCPEWLSYKSSNDADFIIWDNKVSDGTTNLIYLTITNEGYEPEGFEL